MVKRAIMKAPPPRVTITPQKTGAGGQREAEAGLYFYNARFYDPALSRWVQPDLIIPEPYNPLAYDRYQYVYSNPIRYTDSSGHCIDGVTTIACFIVIGGVILKAVDYGWTAYDAYQSGQGNCRSECQPF